MNNCDLQQPPLTAMAAGNGASVKDVPPVVEEYVYDERTNKEANIVC